MIEGVKKYLTQPIEIYSIQEGVDEYGGITLVPTLKEVLSGRMRKLTGQERYISEKTSAVVNYRLYLKTTTSILVTDTIKYKDEEYNIETVNDVMEFGEFMQIDLSRVT